MRQSIFYGGLAARQRAIPLATALFLLFGIPAAFAQQKPDAEKGSATLSVPSAANKARIKPAGDNYEFGNAFSSGQNSPLVLRPELIMPKEYKPRETNIPDFLSLDYLKKPSPLKLDDPVVYRKEDRKYLSEKQNEN